MVVSIPEQRRWFCLDRPNEGLSRLPRHVGHYLADVPLILCSQVDMFSYRCYRFFSFFSLCCFFVLSTVYRWIKDYHKRRQRRSYQDTFCETCAEVERQRRGCPISCRTDIQMILRLFWLELRCAVICDKLTSMTLSVPLLYLFFLCFVLRAKSLSLDSLITKYTWNKYHLVCMYI